MEPEVLVTLGAVFVAFLFRIGKLTKTIITLSPINIKKIVRKLIIIIALCDINNAKLGHLVYYKSKIDILLCKVQFLWCN
ncbi:MAG: hypothetical protein ACJAUQ_001255 [Maribacter sp.]|jgi:hypothetical protein